MPKVINKGKGSNNSLPGDSESSTTSINEIIQQQPIPAKPYKPKKGGLKKPIYKQLVLEPWEEDQQKRKKKAKYQSMHSNTNQTGFDSAGGEGEGVVGEEDEDLDEIAELQEIDKQKQLQEKQLQQQVAEQIERDKIEKMEKQAKLSYYTSYV